MKKSVLIVASLIIFLLCGESLFVFVSRVQTHKTLFAQDISNVSDWGYKLQGYTPNLSSINDSKFDLIVMDYSFGGGPEDEFTAENINRLKFEGPCERKIILAYMSIGEAEEFRFYFNDMPEDLLFEKPNPQFPDNIKVRYWDERWQNIILGNAEDGPDKSYLDRIIDAGFDGVYLDIVSGFEFFGPEEIDGNGERETAARDMVDFVISIADYARNVRGKPNFLVVPQNGPGIIDSSSYSFADDPESEAENQKQRYFAAISAIGAEDTFFFGNRENNNRLNPEEDTIELLNIFRDAGKKVLAIDYIQDEEKIDTFYELTEGEGYVPYASIRELDTVTINTGHEPVCNDILAEGETPVPVPTGTPTLTSSPSPTPEETPTVNGKFFTFTCQKDFKARFSGIEVLHIRVGDTTGCKLTLNQSIINQPLEGVHVTANLKTGNKVSVKIDRAQGLTNRNGEIEFTITALKTGLDWIAWAIPDGNNNIEFNKAAYDNGSAWGMFVNVRENIED